MGQTRNNVVQVNFSDEELERTKTAADEQGLKLGPFIRATVLTAIKRSHPPKATSITKAEELGLLSTISAPLPPLEAEAQITDWSSRIDPADSDGSEAFQATLGAIAKGAPIRTARRNNRDPTAQAKLNALGALVQKEFGADALREQMARVSQQTIQEFDRDAAFFKEVNGILDNPGVVSKG